jgi:hypothetical protein
MGVDSDTRSMNAKGKDERKGAIRSTAHEKCLGRLIEVFIGESMVIHNSLFMMIKSQNRVLSMLHWG